MSTARTNIPAANVGGSRGQGTGRTFTNRNLNTLIKAPARPIGSTSGRSSLLVISGKTTRTVKAVGVAAAPTPLNTPSIRKENKGKDITVNLVPIGSNNGVWGQSSDQKATSDSQDDQQPHQSSVQSRSAPWTSKSNAEHPENESQTQKPQHRDWADVESEDEEEEEERPETKKSNEHVVTHDMSRPPEPSFSNQNQNTSHFQQHDNEMSRGGRDPSWRSEGSGGKDQS
eukprot:gene43245-57549_t